MKTSTHEFHPNFFAVLISVLVLLVVTGIGFFQFGWLLAHAIFG